MSVSITFIVGDDARLSVKWPDVPRVGDFVDLSTNGPTPSVVRVVKVKWWQSGGEPRVDLVCKEEQKNG